MHTSPRSDLTDSPPVSADHAARLFHGLTSASERAGQLVVSRLRRRSAASSTHGATNGHAPAPDHAAETVAAMALDLYAADLARDPALPIMNPARAMMYATEARLLYEAAVESVRLSRAARGEG